MANCTGTDIRTEDVKGLLLVVLVDLVAYFSGDLTKNTGIMQSLV